MGNLGELQTILAMCVFPSNLITTRIFTISLKRYPCRTDSYSQHKCTSLASIVSVTQWFSSAWGEFMHQHRPHWAGCVTSPTPYKANKGNTKPTFLIHRNFKRHVKGGKKKMCGPKKPQSLSLTQAEQNTVMLQHAAKYNPVEHLSFIIKR